MTQTIDLSQIAPPDVIESLDFETIYQALLTDFRRLCPEWTAELESDPVVKLLELAAYRETLLRARINDAARACMLAYATGSDLEHLVALLGVERLGDEVDDRLRVRAQMALEGETVAGSRGSYIFHALSASNDVKDVAVDSPLPGDVRVTVLSNDGEGLATAGLLETVRTYLSAEERRPLTDRVMVESAEIVPFSVDATLNVYPGPASSPILAAAKAAVEAYVVAHAKLGYDISLSGLYAALHQSGVQRVVLTRPSSDVLVSDRQSAYCTGVTIRLGVTDV